MHDRAAYEWREFSECNMCGESLARARTLGRRLGAHQGWRPRRSLGTISTLVQRCVECGLVFANPMPVPTDIDHHYGIPAEDYWRDEELSSSQDYFAEQLDQFRRLYRPPREPAALDGGNKLWALDVGAGVGKAMASLEAAGFATLGLEPSSSFRERAISHTGIAPERLTLGRIEAACYPEARFDLVTFGAVLEHLPDPAAAIIRCLAWTKPQGLLHIEVPSSDWLMTRVLDVAYRVQRLNLTSHLSPLHIPFHLFEFTPTAFERHAARVGYEVAGWRRHVGQTYAPRWADSVLVALMEKTGSGMQLEVWLRKAG